MEAYKSKFPIKIGSTQVFDDMMWKVRVRDERLAEIYSEK